MLEYTTSGAGPRLGLLVHHDDGAARVRLRPQVVRRPSRARRSTTGAARLDGRQHEGRLAHRILTILRIRHGPGFVPQESPIAGRSGDFARSSGTVRPGHRHGCVAVEGGLARRSRAGRAGGIGFAGTGWRSRLTRRPRATRRPLQRQQQRMSAPGSARPATRRPSADGRPRSMRSRCSTQASAPCSAISMTRRYTYQGVTSTFFRRDGKFFVRTDGPDGQLADFEVKYTFGVSPLQQYLVELPGGRLQALSITWDARPRDQGGQRWFRLYPNEQHRPHRRAALDAPRAELELHVRRLPLDRGAQGLRRGNRRVQDDLRRDLGRLRGLPRARLGARRMGQAQRQRAGQGPDGRCSTNGRA